MTDRFSRSRIALVALPFLASAACSTELRVGDGPVIDIWIDGGSSGTTTSDASVNGADDGGNEAGSEADASTFDAGAPAADVSCPTGLCWANPRPTGDAIIGVYAHADDDVWYVTDTGAVMHYDGTSSSVVQAGSGTVTRAHVWVDAAGSAHVWLDEDGEPRCTDEVFVDGGVSGDGTCGGSLETPLLTDVSAVRTVARASDAIDPDWGALVATDTTVLFDGSLGATQPSSNRRLAIGPDALISGDAIMDAFAASDAQGTHVWALTTAGRLYEGDLRNGASLTETSLGVANLSPGVGIWGSSRTDVWVVLDDGDDADFLHFDGTAWTSVQTVPAYPARGNLISGPPVLSNRIWGRGATDIYAYVGISDNGATAYLYHWDGTSWTVVTGQGEPPLDGRTSSARSESPVLSGTSDAIFAGTLYGQLYKRAETASTWTKLAGAAGDYDVTALSVLGEDDVWTVGRRQASSLAGDATVTDELVVTHHAAGASSWTEVPAHATNVTGVASLSLRAFADDDVWVATNDASETPGTVAHWDGAGWRDLALPAQPLQIAGVTGDVWVATSGGLLHGSGGAFSPVSVPGDAGDRETVAGVVRTVGGQLWASVDGEIVHVATSPSLAFARTGCGGAGALVAVAEQVWAASGTTYWDPASGACVHPSGAPFTPTVVGGGDPGDVWFLGTDPTTFRARVAHWNGSSFRVDSIPLPGPTLFAIDANRADNLWVGGAGGSVLRAFLPADADAGTTR